MLRGEVQEHFGFILEMNAEVCTAHASISEFASRCSVVLRDLDIMSTSTGKIRFTGRRLHKMLPYPTPCSGRQRVNAYSVKN